MSNIYIYIYIVLFRFVSFCFVLLRFRFVRSVSVWFGSFVTFRVSIHFFLVSFRSVSFLFFSTSEYFTYFVWYRSGFDSVSFRFHRFCLVLLLPVRLRFVTSNSFRLVSFHPGVRIYHYLIVVRYDLFTATGMWIC